MLEQVVDLVHRCLAMALTNILVSLETPCLLLIKRLQSEDPHTHMDITPSTLSDGEVMRAVRG